MTAGGWRFRPRLITRAAAYRLGVLGVVLTALAAWAWVSMIQMPGDSHRGALPPLTKRQTAIRDEVRADVEKLAGEIGERNDRHLEALNRAAGHVERELERAGLHATRQTYEVQVDRFHNLEAQISGSKEIVVVGAHYDSARGSPGANDNATGVAALLALARRFAGSRPARTLRFVAFANEEPPHFQTEAMGSVRYARRCRRRNEEVVAMLSLETMGWYSEREGTQSYPFPLSLLYPTRGDFIAIVGSYSWRESTRSVVAEFRRSAKFPSEGAAPAAFIPGVGWSDHWSFWEAGYPGVMITDTAPFRYPHYHTARDTPDKIDYERLARVVDELHRVTAALVTAGSGRR